MLPGAPARALAPRESNAAATKRYRDRKRRADALARAENVSLRRECANLRAELAHARWVLDEVARRLGLGSGRGEALARRVTSTIAHGRACPLRGVGEGGPFRLDGVGGRRRRTGSDDDDELAAFLREFLVAPETCPCPGHAA